MRPPTRCAVLLAALACAAGGARAQAIRGRVVDAASGRGVAHARVEVIRDDQSVAIRGRTDSDGDFLVPAPTGMPVRIRSGRTGYDRMPRRA